MREYPIEKSGSSEMLSKNGKSKQIADDQFAFIAQLESSGLFARLIEIEKLLEEKSA